jgi:hypothetical protein
MDPDPDTDPVKLFTGTLDYPEDDAEEDEGIL